jgi:5-methylcytosine-specific restriction endonuclease McrA
MPNTAPTFRPPHSARKRAPENRPGPSARGYDARWVAFRASVINTRPDYWLQCTHCRQYVSDPSQIHLDHITPLARGGKRFDKDNLQPLCKWCHGRKTREENKTQ